MALARNAYNSFDLKLIVADDDDDNFRLDICYALNLVYSQARQAVDMQCKDEQ